MNNTDYSIDEIKLMAKVKRYKRRWKEQRNYSEYLKCKLAKKSLQVQELKAENAALHARIAELETMVERLVEEGGAMVKNFVIYASLQGNEKPRSEAKNWYALVAEWQERKNE
jgi:chromosome condensin MukBEF ATPase and DNA-binding subunit MukB